MFQINSNVYSFTILGPLNVRTEIQIHCSLAVKNLRTESLLFLFSKKDKFIFSYTFHKYSVFFFFTIHVISVKYTLISNCYKTRRRLNQTLESAQTRESLRYLQPRTRHGLSCHTHTLSMKTQPQAPLNKFVWAF